MSTPLPHNVADHRGFRPSEDLIADALVVVFTYGVSLRTWSDTGGIARELALYEALASSYSVIVLCTYGGPGDAELLASALPASLHSKFRLVCNDQRVETSRYAAQLPALVRKAVGDGDAKRVIVKTNQMAGGHIASHIAQNLRSWGITTALVARGGYLWSRMTAYEHGPQSRQAREAGAIEAELCATADIVVGTTREMLDDLAWRYHLANDRLRLIPNYILVPENTLPDESSRVPGLLLYAGQLVKRKRVDILIDAVAALDPEVRKDVSLEIIGDGPELESLGAQAATCGAPVLFRSRLPHAALMERMSQCSLYLQASEMEGHPKTVLEAMAAGAPVVVAATPGLAQVVTHGITGLRVGGDVESFSRAIHELLADPSWREILSTGAARTMRATLSLAVTVPKEQESHRAALARAATSTKLRMSV